MVGTVPVCSKMKNKVEETEVASVSFTGSKVNKFHLLCYGAKNKSKQTYRFTDLSALIDAASQSSSILIRIVNNALDLFEVRN